MWCGSLLWHSNRFCALVQLLRWLVDSDMAGLWTAGRQVSSCTYCKLWHKTLREKIIVLIFFLNLYTSYKVTGWHADLHTCLKLAKIAHYVMLHNRPCWWVFFTFWCALFPFSSPQAVRQPSFLWWNWWRWLWKPRQEPVPKDPGRRLRVWLSVLGWHLWFRYLWDNQIWDISSLLTSTCHVYVPIHQDNKPFFLLSFFYVIFLWQPRVWLLVWWRWIKTRDWQPRRL